MNLTIVILTKNEEKNIVEAIENCKLATEHVLVVDSGSTDNTVSLAEQHGAKVVFRAWDNDFAAQRNFALQHVDTEWVLYLDADERMNAELVQAVKNVVQDNKDAQYKIKRKSTAFGKEFNYGVLKPDFVPRMFKKDAVRWVNKVHERPECKMPVITLSGFAKHYTYSSWNYYFDKLNHYTTIWAEDAFEQGKKTNLVSAFGHAVSGFLKMYIIERGFMDGGMGLVLCCNHFVYVLMKYVKLIDLQRRSK